jgi:hypothetical protein
MPGLPWSYFKAGRLRSSFSSEGGVFTRQSISAYKGDAISMQSLRAFVAQARPGIGNVFRMGDDEVIAQVARHFDFEPEWPLRGSTVGGLGGSGAAAASEQGAGGSQGQRPGNTGDGERRPAERNYQAPPPSMTEARKAPTPTPNTAPPPLVQHATAGATSSSGVTAGGAGKPPQPIVCELVKAQIQCQHGRSPSPGGLLEVVPSEIGDVITLSGQMKGGCGKHPEWQISGYGTETKKGAKSSFRANQWRALRPLPWLAEIIPHSYEVSVSACSGIAQTWQVNAYPSDQFSIQIDFEKLAEAKKRLDWAIEGVLSQYVKKADFKLLEGKAKGQAGWQEHKKDHRAYYKYDVSLGFNPLIGGELRIPFGPTAVIPEWLKKYGDAYFFFEIKGGLDVNAHWQRSSPDEREIFADAKGFLEVAVGASLFFVDPHAVKAEVAGSTAIEATAKPEAEGDKLVVAGEVGWAGLKATVTIEFAWGIVEYKREFKLWDGSKWGDFHFDLVS